ncbi:MAG: nucleotide sugar dehydrogenase [Deltaproteobacteria bacterium]|nr:nucleotide sugar dehydrogenase [Deltaproteobacteria bacterium]
MFKKNILCIGAGYVGGPTMAVIAHHCPDYRVVVVDINHDRIQQWNSGNLPIYEPGLSEIVAEALGKNLFFSTDVDGHIDQADIIFVSVNTPTKTFGLGAGKAADLQYWEQTARQILKASSTGKIVVEKSTLPVKTAAAIGRILDSNDKGIHFEVVSNPEFLAEGSAIHDLEHPDRVLIGARPTESGQAAMLQVVDIYRHWIPEERIITSNVWSSELSKLVANAFLAQRVSSINTISALCEKTNADIEEVAKAVGMDSRIGPKFLKAGVGFGGSCFKKDILNLTYIAENYGLFEVARYWEQVVEINSYQQRRFVNLIITNMFNTIVGKRIAIFGFSFKADTGDVRESPAINVCQALLDEKAVLAIHDPKALEGAAQELGDYAGQFSLETDPYEAASGAHAVVIATDWNEFSTLDYKRIYDSMEKPAFIFDGRNLLDHQKLYEIGFSVHRIGRPSLSRI